ncbi:MAG TPA: hypothetical protein DIU20_02080, partial [Cryomorphaceae bacterium]|nr:hypothetical protein [Cryomorphaceae bacterium]
KDATVYVLVDADGNANYDIVKPSADTTSVESDTASSDFKLTLKSYEVENLNLTYEDIPGEIKVVINDLDHEGVGDFTQEVVDLKTKTSIGAFTAQSGGVAYLNKVHTEADMDFQFNQVETKLTFGQNSLSLNDLALNFSGFVAVPGDDINMDLKFNAPQNKFKNVLSLIPVIYTQDFEKVKTSGDFALEGAVSGTYNGDREVYPAFDVKLNVNNATFRYPDLPAAVEGIKVNAHIYNKTANLDGTVVDIPEARANVAGSPVDARLNLKTPISDPEFAAYLKTDFDLANVGKVVPAQGFDYKGRVKADLDLAGGMSDIDNERYENVKAQGVLMVQDVELKSDSLPFPVQIAQLDMQFSPQKVDLSSFRAQLGKSDISANGQIDNLIGYVLEDQMLKANFTLNSSLLDLNELSGASGDEPAGEKNTADTSSLEVIRVPENVDFGLTANIAKLIYDNLEITSVKGNLAVKEGTVRMDDVVMDLLGGSVALNGNYDSKPAAPLVNMNLKINNFSFKESFEKFVTVQRLAPIMQNTTGTYSSGFSFNANLNPDMSPDLASVEAAGSLVTEGMKTTTKSMQKLADMVKNQSLATLYVGKVNLSFKIQDGRIQVEPFSLKAGNVTATVQGSNGLDQSLDYTMDMKIPVSGIGSSNLLSKVGATQGGKLDLGVKIGGTVQDPKVTTSLGDLVDNVIDNVKKQVEQKVEEVKEDAINKVNEEAKKLIDAAEAQGDKLIAAAQEQAAKIRSSAKEQADKLIAAADEQATKIENEAKGNILKEKGAKLTADKIRKEAREKADKLVDEANKKADQLVNNARDEKQKLIEQAREKGKLENK